MADPEIPPGGARRFIPATKSLKKLAEAVDDCQGCPLYKNATHGVFGEGGKASRVLIVGEQPGDQEDRAGKPFVGPAGGVLDRALDEAGIARGDVFVTNAVKHFKWEPRGKRRIHQTPRWSEVKACRPWLEEELARVKPDVVVALGSTAAQAMMGPQFRILKNRGKVHKSEKAESLVVSIHPSAVLRAPDKEAREANYTMLAADLKLAKKQSGRM
ncbi:MAG: UdgX family uracil-DNA binding protein [Vicinamibacterales bacterium]